MKKNNLIIISLVLTVMATISLGCSKKLSISNEQISQALVEKKTIDNTKRSDESVDHKSGEVDFTSPNIKYCFDLDERMSATSEETASISLILISTEPQKFGKDARIGYGNVHLTLVKETGKWRITEDYSGDLRIKIISDEESLEHVKSTDDLCSNFDSSKK